MQIVCLQKSMVCDGDGDGDGDGNGDGDDDDDDDDGDDGDDDVSMLLCISSFQKLLRRFKTIKPFS